jgi:hypothetical protein
MCRAWKIATAAPQNGKLRVTAGGDAQLPQFMKPRSLGQFFYRGVSETPGALLSRRFRGLLVKQEKRRRSHGIETERVVHCHSYCRPRRTQRYGSKVWLICAGTADPQAIVLPDRTNLRSVNHMISLSLSLSLRQRGHQYGAQVRHG